MPGPKLNPLSSNIGIAEVVSSRGDMRDLLPAETGFFPSDEPIAGNLERAVATRCLEDALGEAMRVEVDNPDLLRPSRFEAMLHDSPGELTRLARTLPEGAGREQVARAASLLHDEASLQDLLKFYRQALLRA